jgi:hypothetical protein
MHCLFTTFRARILALHIGATPEHGKKFERSLTNVSWFASTATQRFTLAYMIQCSPIQRWIAEKRGEFREASARAFGCGGGNPEPSPAKRQWS